MLRWARTPTKTDVGGPGRDAPEYTPLRDLIGCGLSLHGNPRLGSSACVQEVRFGGLTALVPGALSQENGRV